MKSDRTSLKGDGSDPALISAPICKLDGSFFNARHGFHSLLTLEEMRASRIKNANISRGAATCRIIYSRRLTQSS